MHKFILVFFDDILVYNKFVDEHVGHLEVVFEILYTNQLAVKLKGRSTIFGSYNLGRRCDVGPRKDGCNGMMALTNISQWVKKFSRSYRLLQEVNSRICKACNSIN